MYVCIYVYTCITYSLSCDFFLKTCVVLIISKWKAHYKPLYEKENSYRRWCLLKIFQVSEFNFFFYFCQLLLLPFIQESQET